MDESLAYEETPIIEPVTSGISPDLTPAPAAPPPTPSPKPAPAKRTSPIMLFILFTLLFGIGVFASSYIRQLLPLTPTPQPTVTPAPVVTTPPNPYADWKTYSVISGVTRKAVDGISFRLPPEVAELFCDGKNCASQGAYLPGNTRFTVAARGTGQILADYRGKAVTDFLGHTFTTTPTTVAGRPALAFVGDFSGTTLTGYSFTKMRGVMISVTDTLSLEVNHFAPSGVTTDFAGDDVLFTKILETFHFTGLPLPSTTPVATSSATP